MFGLYQYVDENENIQLTDDHILIFSSIENLRKFGFKPHDKISEDNLKNLFKDGKKAKFIVHYSSASSEEDTIKIAHIDRI